MNTTALIASDHFADLSQISGQKARAALAKCHKGGTWRGAALQVITERGAGGNAGRRYLVAVDSLPADLRAKLADAPDDELDATADEIAELPYLSDCQRNQAQLRRDIVREAKLHGVQSAAETTWRTQYGMRQFGKTAIYEWMKLEEEGGVLALISKSRSDRGGIACPAPSIKPSPARKRSSSASSARSRRWRKASTPPASR